MAKKGPMKGMQRGIGKANTSLQSIASVLEQQSDTLKQLTENSAAVQDEQTGGGSSQLIALKILQAQIELQKDANASLKKLVDGQNKQVDAIVKGNKDWKTFGDKFKDLKRDLTQALDPDTIKKSLLGPFTMFKGVRDKMEDMDYVKRMKALGSTKSKKELKEDAVETRKAKTQVLRSQEEIDRLKGMGASEDEIKKSRPDLYNERNAALKRYNDLRVVQPTDGKTAKATGGDTSAPLVKTPSDKGALAQSTTDLLADQQAQKENQLESIRILNKQTDLLQQIANNTAGKANASAAGGTEDTGMAGAGVFGVVGAGFKVLGEGMRMIGGAAGKGIAALMRGIAAGARALANPVVIVGLGAFTLAMMGIGKALQWAAPAIEAFAPVLMKFAEVVGEVFLGAIRAIPDIIGTIGQVIIGVIGSIGDVITNTIDAVTTSIERLAAIDGNNLMNVGLGIAAVSAGLIAFAGANVAGGITNLVSGFLNAVSGQGSPIDQLERLANMGDKLFGAADAISAVAEAMKGFADIDPDSMKAINDFPWGRAIAFVAAGGGMTMANGAKIYNTSKANADQQALVDAQGNSGGTQNNVTQVNQNSVQNTTVKPSVRNQESSQSKYMASRY